MVLKRIQLVERKMANNSEFSKLYTSKINEYLVKNYAKNLSPEEAAMTSDRTWYLPHFATSNMNKGNKLRFVFDDAAQVHGMSLNSMLLKGPGE